jgi:hypothetical protein
MGLTIHYSGRLRKAEDLPTLIEEVKDISSVYGWKYHIYETHFPNDTFEKRTSFENVYGINFTPANCETISLTFLSNGVMASASGIKFFVGTESEKYIYNLFCKTQYAGVFVHQLIIHLFRHLSKKYFENFNLEDESYYWETDDESVMKKQFEVYNSLLDNFVLSIETFPIEKGEDMVTYFERLMKHVNSLRKE